MDKEQELPTTGQIQLLQVFSLFCDNRQCIDCELNKECDGAITNILEKLTK